jgi:hypothetical protein
VGRIEARMPQRAGVHFLFSLQNVFSDSGELSGRQGCLKRDFISVQRGRAAV